MVWAVVYGVGAALLGTALFVGGVAPFLYFRRLGHAVGFVAYRRSSHNYSAQKTSSSGQGSGAMNAGDVYCFPM